MTGLAREVEAGRELDAEVAERVMSWTRHPEKMHPTENRTIGGVLYCPPDYPYDTGEANVVPRYSTSIAAAWEVVERMTALGWDYFIGGRPDFDTPQHEVTFDKGIGPDQREEWDIAPTAPLAICRAALKAVTPPAPTSEQR